MIRTTSTASQTGLITLIAFVILFIVPLLTGSARGCPLIISWCRTCGTALDSLRRAISHRVPAEDALITRSHCCSRVLEQAVSCVTSSAHSTTGLCAYLTPLSPSIITLYHTLSPSITHCTAFTT
eukprot:XP_001709618.1 Hypothetical protein GL50803_18722 [Giardia lamblia ATCC 50803]